ncbi:MAG: hypothetical protein EKK33_17655 [Bradyrhizobiaceae bacterium]|nr:MAG: hypothetical protein EKK33_17655 [Bradyrhizobiaceae bacterium]
MPTNAAARSRSSPANIGAHNSRKPCSERIRACCGARNFFASSASSGQKTQEDIMGFGRGALLWLLGVPLPIVLLLALFWHH